MNALTIFLIETLIIALTIVVLHRFKNFFGIGLLLIFLGSVQFFQTVLASSVYNEILPGIVVSPGSAILFTSTLICILLLFHTEGIKKTRLAVFGVVFCNVILAIISSISLKQVTLDNHSIHNEYIQEIFNFDVTMFLIGSIVLFLDFFLIIVFYQLINLKFEKLPTLLKLLIPVSISGLFDSMLYYSVNLVDLENSNDLLLSNIVGKQITILIFTLVIYFYLHFFNLKKPKENPENTNDIFSIFVIIDETSNDI